MCYLHFNELCFSIWTANFPYCIQTSVTDRKTLFLAIQFCAGAVCPVIWVLTWACSAVVKLNFIGLWVCVPACMQTASHSHFCDTCLMSFFKRNNLCHPPLLQLPLGTNTLIHSIYCASSLLTLVTGVSLISHLVPVMTFNWTRHNSAHRITHLASKKPPFGVLWLGCLLDV